MLKKFAVFFALHSLLRQWMLRLSWLLHNIPGHQHLFPGMCGLLAEAHVQPSMLCRLLALATGEGIDASPGTSGAEKRVCTGAHAGSRPGSWCVGLRRRSIDNATSFFKENINAIASCYNTRVTDGRAHDSLH